MREEPSPTFHDQWPVADLDLERYLRRVGLEARSPSLEALTDLIRAHRSTFTFDNIDVLLDQHPGVDLATIQAKFLGRGRGGYCYEHSVLFAAVLDRLGYDVAVHLGRVGDRLRRARTHLVVLVDLEHQTCMTDPGFGFTFPEPLPLVDGVEHTQSGESFRVDLLRDGPSPAWSVSRRRSDGWEVLHATDLLPVRPADVEMAHVFSSTWRDSHFRHRLLLSLLHPDGSHTSVAHDGVTVRRPGGPTRKRPFAMRDLPTLLDELRVPLSDEERRRLTERVRQLVEATGTPRSAEPRNAGRVSGPPRTTATFSNPSARDWVAPPGPDARAFHRTLPGYAPTPLVDAPALAAELGVGAVLVKDESSRLGLPAFKVLGASWAARRVLDESPGATLVTATDGNHGRAVARMATRSGTNAVVFVPAVMSPATAALIEGEGAEVRWVDGDYDDAVRAAAEFAADDDGVRLVQDTAWPGYERVPGWIVEGYDTLLVEIDEHLGRAPDLVVVPVGVGSLAQAVVAHYRRDGTRGTRILAVEPDTAATLVASLERGEPTTVDTAATVMAGLDCGTVSSLAWPVLRDGLDAAVTVSDADARRASSDLASAGVSSGASGAATLAGLRAARADAVLWRDLDLSDDAVVVLLSTEGAPDSTT